MFFKKFIIFSLIWISLASFSQTSFAQNVFPSQLTLDGRTWKLDFNNETDQMIIGEYVTGNDTVKHWNELFTFQKFKFAINEKITPADFAQLEIEELKKKENYKATFKISPINQQEAIFEFKISAPIPEQQDELQRIIKTPDNKLIVIHYVIKKDDMGDAERTKWTNILKNVDYGFLNK